MNKALLKSKMVLHGDTNQTLSEHLGITPVTFSRKLNEIDGAEFSQRELLAIKNRYSLTDEEFVLIFFNDDVSN